MKKKDHSKKIKSKNITMIKISYSHHLTIIFRHDICKLRHQNPRIFELLLRIVDLIYLLFSFFLKKKQND